MSITGDSANSTGDYYPYAPWPPYPAYPNPSLPCPSCGYCPTCGRRRYGWHTEPCLPWGNTGTSGSVSDNMDITIGYSDDHSDCVCQT